MTNPEDTGGMLDPIRAVAHEMAAAPRLHFTPPATLAEVDALDEAERLDGLRSYEKGDPEPGPNRGRAFWWGWWCGKNPRPESDDPRDVEVYWAMRAIATEMRDASAHG